jgi:hypothetical protein
MLMAADLAAVGYPCKSYCGVTPSGKARASKVAPAKAFGQLGDHHSELFLGQVCLHAVDESRGDDDTRLVAGRSMLEHEVAMVAGSAVVMD